MRIWSAAAILLIYACPASAENAAESVVHPAPHERRSADKEVCALGHYPRSSELCAQWKSADAAEESALWTKLGVIVTGLGIIGLIFTIAQSKAALDRAREANTIAADGHRETLQPYIAVHRASLQIDESVQPIAHVDLMNFGQSPALDVQTWYSIWVECFPLHDPLPRAPDELPRGSEVLGPGRTTEIIHPRGNPLNAISQKEIMAGRAAIYVYGESRYSDIWGRKYCSEFLLFASGRDQIERRRLAAYSEGNIIRRLDDDEC